MDQNKRVEQKRIRQGVERAYALRPEDLEWKPYYPNNMLQCGQEGWYCVIQGPNGEFARKYTIVFQYPENEDCAACPNQGIDRYILYERCYSGNNGPIAYPEPSRESAGPSSPALGVNDFGRFVYAHKTLEQAKKRALSSYQAVYGYAMSHLLEPEEDAP